MDWGTTLTFWFLALVPGFLHPIILFIYFQRFRARKDILLNLINRDPAATGRLEVTRNQMAKWKDKLDLPLLSYVLPTVLCGLLSAGAGIVLMSLHDPANELHLSTGVKNLLTSIQSPAVAGFAGAFVWGMYDFIDRFRILNLSPAALHMTWFRLMLGPVLGYFLQYVVKDSLGPFVAFAVATLPVPDIAQWVREKARSALSITASASAIPQWELLQGLTPDIISRLIEADVSSVAHLANQDPINLLRRTNLEWRNVLDMMDQAYLCTYVTDKLPKLRLRGIRGAIEIAILHTRLDRGTWTLDFSKQSAPMEAEGVVKALALDLATDEVSVRNLARNFYEDPQVDLIWTLWYGRDESEYPPVRPGSDRGKDEPRSESPDGLTKAPVEYSQLEPSS